VLFCPEACDEEVIGDRFSSGTCFGAIEEACIYQAKKPQTRDLVRWTYVLRHEKGENQNGYTQAFNDMLERNGDLAYLRDIHEEMGRPTSSFLALFNWDEKKYGFNSRDQIYDYIKKNKELSKVANRDL